MYYKYVLKFKESGVSHKMP